MPKLLFSRIRISGPKDLFQNVKPPRRIDIVLSRKRQKEDTQRMFRFKDNIREPTLEKGLKDKKFHSAFRAFLHTEFSEENIEFWCACEAYRKTSSPGDLSSKAAGIYHEFLHPLAEKEINIDHCMKEKIRRAMVNPSLFCFDEAQRHVYHLMKSDSCPRFFRSNAYLSLKRNTKNLW